MAALIDSSVLIAIERGELSFDGLLNELAEEGFAISAVTASELLHGMHRARTSLQRTRRQAFVEGLLSQIPVVAFDQEIARVHASVWAELAKRGVIVGERDLLIGVTALVRDFAMLTRDKRSFPRIPGLKVRQL